MNEPRGGITRRRFIGGAAAVTAGLTQKEGAMALSSAANIPGDGPVSPLFSPLKLAGGQPLDDLKQAAVSSQLRDNLGAAPRGQLVSWGIPFAIDQVAVAAKAPVTLRWPGATAPWFVVMHTADIAPPERDAHGFIPASPGQGRLNEHVGDYVFLYADGSEERAPIRRRHHIGMVQRMWGENCFQAVAHRKPHPIRTSTEQPREGVQWGWAQTRANQPDNGQWTNWLWAWENPHPEKAVVGLRIEPKTGTLILSAVSAGQVASIPTRWEPRQKAVLRLPEGAKFDPNLTWSGLLSAIQLDLGQVISAQQRAVYPNAQWEKSEIALPPGLSDKELLVEYSAHPEARFHLPDGTLVPVAALAKAAEGPLSPVAPARQRVKLRVTEKGSSKPVAVRLHVHGEAGEYLAPVDRNRIPNVYWYEDWSVDNINQGTHNATYIPGETVLDLPLGKVYVEISKGFEVTPIRKVVRVTRSTTELAFELERVLPWRERGWVTADTHVHFLSPTSAHLEGAGEGVNVVNLLASQWGELMTNVGDFDGSTTYGSRETGHDGEYLVRVGTENRQHVMGHISLLGYSGPIIAPMTTGGPDESALGDPIEILLTEWARQCRKQGGIVVLPHFPNPRAEHAAAIVEGQIDAVEMTCWGYPYAGIDPYSLSDWYRYLNNGYFVAAVGGTDKMSATTCVGAVRTYAKLPKDRPFDLAGWKEAVRAGQTFVSYGPLMEFSVEGKPSGSRIRMGKGGGSVEVQWQLASATVPMSRVELVVNGEIRESQAVGATDAAGHWTVKLDRSSWVALLVRGHYPNRPEIIAAHSSPVMVEVEGKPFFSAADALTIVEQIEGALAYLDTVGTRAETAAYRRMRLVLTGAHRDLHNRLHKQGVYHDHTPATDHAEHRGGK